MSAQPYFRSRAQRRDRDAELEQLVAAELDACRPPAPVTSVWTDELSAAERDFVELVRTWLERRPNKHQLMQLICEDLAPANIATPTQPQVEPTPPSSPAEPDSHAAP
jgi:hypothetical protein